MYQKNYNVHKICVVKIQGFIMLPQILTMSEISFALFLNSDISEIWYHASYEHAIHMIIFTSIPHTLTVYQILIIKIVLLVSGRS